MNETEASNIISMNFHPSGGIASHLSSCTGTPDTNNHAGACGKLKADDSSSDEEIKEIPRCIPSDSQSSSSGSDDSDIPIQFHHSDNMKKTGTPDTYNHAGACGKLKADDSSSDEEIKEIPRCIPSDSLSSSSGSDDSDIPIQFHHSDNMKKTADLPSDRESSSESSVDVDSPIQFDRSDYLPSEETADLPSDRESSSESSGDSSSPIQFYHSDNLHSEETDKVHIEHADVYQISREQQQQLFVKKKESMIKVKGEKDVTPESDKVNIILEFSEDFQKIVEKVVRDSLTSPEGVAKVEVLFGSNNIELTLEEGYIVTEEWIQNILKTLFNSKLALWISEGGKLRVTVQRRLYIQANEIPSLYVRHGNSTLHENSTQHSELNAQIETLKSRVRELECDLDRIREEQMTETTALLLSKLHNYTLDGATSGYDSLDGSIASTDTH